MFTAHTQRVQQLYVYVQRIEEAAEQTFESLQRRSAVRSQ